MTLTADQLAAFPPPFLVDDVLATVMKPYMFAKGAPSACPASLQ